MSIALSFVGGGAMLISGLAMKQEAQMLDENSAKLEALLQSADLQPLLLFAVLLTTYHLYLLSTS